MLAAKLQVEAPVGSPNMKGTLQITGDAAADELLNTDALALLLGMLLDHHMR